MDAYIGKLLDNRYEILEVIGTGGMAIVYKAMDHRLNRQVAVKVLKSDLAQNADFCRRFHDEAHAVAMLSHPNIVSVYDVSRDSESEYIVMELIDGITLKQYMERRGHLNWRESLHFITQIMKGLSHAHGRGIIHRDIKPHNIMILRDGSVKVTDFGIARLVASTDNTLTQEALGSVHYISPEQAKGGHTDARTDIYSAGVVLYEMLVDRLPFEGDSAVSIAIQHISSVPLSPREVNPDIPEPLELITMKAMAPDMEKRYATAAAMIRDLDEFRKNPNINFDYVLSDFAPEETDEPTHPIRSREIAHRQNARRQEERYDAYDDYDDYGSGRRNQGSQKKAVMIGAITAAIALILVLFSVIFSGFGGGGDEEFVIPNIMGKTLAELERDEEFNERFRVEVSGSDFSDEYKKDEIMSQTPEKNRTKKGPKGEKYVITVEISLGEQTDTVPNMVGYTRVGAQNVLRAMDLNLQIRFEEKYDDTAAEGTVISTEPAEGTSLKRGDSVTIFVSKGKEVIPVTVISYVGMKLDTVKTNLNGLTLGTVTERENESEAGTILEQTPASGSQVETGTKIDFVVSKGPAQDPAQEEPNAITRRYELPEGEGVVYVEVLVGTETRFAGNVDRANRILECTLTGVGVQDVTVKFDGVTVIEEKVDFSS